MNARNSLSQQKKNPAPSRPSHNNSVRKYSVPATVGSNSNLQNSNGANNGYMAAARSNLKKPPPSPKPLSRTSSVGKLVNNFEVLDTSGSESPYYGTLRNTNGIYGTQGRSSGRPGFRGATQLTQSKPAFLTVKPELRHTVSVPQYCLSICCREFSALRIRH